MSVRARLTGFLLAVSALFALGLVGASPAAAIPGLPDCKEPPVVYSPSDSAVLQWLDPRTGEEAANGAAFGSTPRIYDAYGYAGFQWSTYDLGCAGALSSFDSLNATADTATGNKLLGLAVAQTAMTNGIHSRLGNLSQFMAPLDDVVSQTTAALRDAIYRPWIGGALAVVVVVMLALASVGQLSHTVRAGAWALAVLTVTMGVLNYPVKAAQFFDQTVSSSITAVNDAAAGFTTSSSEAVASGGRGNLLVDQVLYQSWLRGEFGTTSGPAVEKYGEKLWQAHTLTFQEAQDSRAGGEAAKTIVEQKNGLWSQTMEHIAEDDPSLYQQLQGKKGGRMGVGAMTLASTSATALFRMIADLYTLLGMVVIRLLVMFAPLVGLLGVVMVFGGVVRWAGNMLGAAVINTVGFSLAALVHTIATNALLNGSGGGLEFGRLLLGALLTVGLFVVCWPLLSLRRIAGRDHRPGAGLMAKGGRMARSYFVTRSATSAGVREAVDGDVPGAAGSGEDGRYRWSRRDHMTYATRPESRPRTQSPVTERRVSWASRPALTALPVGRGPGPEPATASVMARTDLSTDGSQHPHADSRGSGSAAIGSVRPRDVEVREVARRRAVDGGLYVPEPPQSGHASPRVVTGRVMAPGEDPFSRRPVHDSNRHNGDAPHVVYVYDPKQARDVPISDVDSATARVDAGDATGGSTR